MKKSQFIGPHDLHLVSWEVAQPRAILQIVHGMVEHIERYHDFALAMNQAGYTVLGHDHLGHGKTAKSPEELGVFPEDPEALIDEMERVTHHIEDTYPAVPLVLLGHSMGSLMSRYYVATRKPRIAGFIIMATGQQAPYLTQIALGLTKGLKWIKGPSHRSPLLTFLSTDSFNRKIKNPQTKVDWLSTDPQSNQAYLEDPLCQFVPTIPMYRAIFYFSNQVAKKPLIKAIPHELPLLVVSGAEDPLGENGKGIQRLAHLLRETDHQLTLHLIDGARHEILNETNKEATYHYLADWIQHLL